jgi:hypothetical protein
MLLFYSRILAAQFHVISICCRAVISRKAVNFARLKFRYPTPTRAAARNLLKNECLELPVTAYFFWLSIIGLPVEFANSRNDMLANFGGKVEPATIRANKMCRTAVPFPLSLFDHGSAPLFPIRFRRTFQRGVDHSDRDHDPDPERDHDPDHGRNHDPDRDPDHDHARAHARTPDRDHDSDRDPDRNPDLYFCFSPRITS